MNFLDSLFDKIPIIRDMNRKKRMLAMTFVVFAVITILGILIDAIAEADGVVVLIFVALGFLLMAAIILADFFMSKSNSKNTPSPDEQYNFFEDSSDEFPYQNESYDYQTQENPSDNNYDGSPVNDVLGSNYNNESYDNGEYNTDYQDNFSVEEIGEVNSYQTQQGNIEYTVNAETIPEEPAPKRFGGIFRRGQTNENTAISNEINNIKPDNFNVNVNTDSAFVNGYNSEYEAVQSSFEFTQEDNTQIEEMPVQDTQSVQLPYSNQSFSENRPAVNYNPNKDFEDDYIGEPVMTFPNPSRNLNEEVSSTVDFVAPNIVPPTVPDVVGGPVMSIPSRGYHPTVTENLPPVQSYTTPVHQPAYASVTQASASQSAYSPSESKIPAYQQGTRGQEIENFFDNMSDEELLYSDCVEVWASDAKPAAIRLLKQIESLSDKKMADSLGREAEYVNAMLDRIYYFTMLDSIKDNLELKKYNFSVMVKECLRRFSPFFMEKRIGLLWKGLDIDIITDKRWLIFALTQVVFNAVEFTGLGGKIAISAKKEGSLIHLMVDDSGCGISEKDMPHIFMAGFMGDNVPNESGRRTGMGLFITRSVVEKLGGTVTAESAQDKGTRITIILPENP